MRPRGAAATLVDCGRGGRVISAKHSLCVRRREEEEEEEDLFGARRREEARYRNLCGPKSYIANLPLFPLPAVPLSQAAFKGYQVSHPRWEKTVYRAWAGRGGQSWLRNANNQHIQHYRRSSWRRKEVVVEYTMLHRNLIPVSFHFRSAPRRRRAISPYKK